MKFSKEYKKLKYPIFTTIRQDGGYYRECQQVKIETPEQNFWAEIVSIRKIGLEDITNTLALRDADCSVEDIINLFKRFYKEEAGKLILITLMRCE